MCKVTYLVRPGLKFLKTNDGVFIGRLHEENAHYIFLSQLEAIILLLSDGSNTVHDVTHKVSIMYDVEFNKVLKDVKNFYERRKNLFIKLQHPIDNPVKITKDPNIFKFRPKKHDVRQFYHIAQLGLVLSEKCPLKCKYCYAFNNRSKENIGLDFVDIKLAKKFIREGTNLGAYKLLIGGGDPLRYKHLPELIEYSILHGIRDIYISTKPTKLYTIEYFNKLFQSGIRKLQFSMDAVTPEVLNSIVGHPKYYDYLISAIFNAISSGIEIVIKTVLIKDNIGEIEGILNFSYNMGIKEVYINTAAPIGMAHFGMLPSVSEELEIEKIVNEGRKRYQDMNIIFAPNPLKLNMDSHTLNKSPISCSAFTTNCFLYPDGSIEGCDFMGSFRHKHNLSAGNLKKDSLKNIWFNSEMAMIYRRTPSESFCTNCKFKDMCYGGCKALSLLFFNDIKKPFNYCPPVLKQISAIPKKDESYEK